MPIQPQKILAVVDDLMFTVKINDAAKRNGFEAVFLKSEQDVLDRLADSKPPLVILDLNANSVDPLQLVAKIRGNADYKRTNLIGYLSHVQGELKQQAQEAGVDMVMARSAFSQNLLQILKRYSGRP
jgi:PleD family two-component response regulator